MSIEGAIAEWMENDSNPGNTKPLTNGRVYAVELPHEPRYPAVTITQVSIPEDETDHDGNTVFQTARIQIDVYAGTLSEARNISDLLKTGFSGLHNSQIGAGNPDGGLFVFSCFRDNEFVTKEPEIKRWRITHDFLISF
jgi:hypothetical protein